MSYSSTDGNYEKPESTETYYKGFLINEVYKYSSGKSDFEVFPDNGNEAGSMYPYTTIGKIMAEIDETTNFVHL